MKKKCLFLACLLLISGTAVGLMGIVVKYAVLEPLGVYREEPAVALPFILLRDEGLQYVITTLQDQQTQPVSTAPTETEPPETQPEEATEEKKDLLEKPLFIGDSRTCGLRDHARIAGADYFCEVGMSVFNASQQRLSDEGFAEQTLAEVLAGESYSCVILSLGLNESGYPLESLVDAYGTFLEKVVKAQSQAVIVLQGVMTVGREWERRAPYTALENLARINERIRKMADGDRIVYIDPNEEFADSDGYLPEEMSADGCHLYAKYNSLLSDWLCRKIGELDT